MLGEALDAWRDGVTKAFHLPEGTDLDRVKTEIALLRVTGSADVVGMQHRLDAAMDRERQALARAERAEDQLGELRSLLADLAELFGCAPTRAELAPRAADAAEAWHAREPVTPEESEAIRERFLAASGPAQGESDDPAMAIYRPWTRSADELAAHLEALPREDWEQVRQAFGVASGARIIERLTMRIMRGARAA